MNNIQELVENNDQVIFISNVSLLSNLQFSFTYVGLFSYSGQCFIFFEGATVCSCPVKGSWPQNATTSCSSSPWLWSTLSKWTPLLKLAHNKEIVSATARDVKGPDPSRDKVKRQAPVSWFQIFTLQSCDEVAIAGIEAKALGRKIQDATVWKCPLYSQILFRVCLRSHSVAPQPSPPKPLLRETHLCPSSLTAQYVWMCCWVGNVWATCSPRLSHSLMVLSSEVWST